MTAHACIATSNTPHALCSEDMLTVAHSRMWVYGQDTYLVGKGQVGGNGVREREGEDVEEGAQVDAPVLLRLEHAVHDLQRHRMPAKRCARTADAECACAHGYSAHIVTLSGLGGIEPGPRPTPCRWYTIRHSCSSYVQLASAVTQGHCIHCIWNERLCKAASLYARALDFMHAVTCQTRPETSTEMPT